MSTVKEILCGPEPVHRKNFVQANVNFVKTFPKNLGSKPRAQSSISRSRNPIVGATARRVDRPATAVNSNTNHMKNRCDAKAVWISGSSISSFRQANHPAAKSCPPRDGKVLVAPKVEACQSDRQSKNLAKSANYRRLIAEIESSLKVTMPASYKDASSQTIEIRTVDELYKEGVIVYPSSRVLANDRLAPDRPIRLDSASQTDQDHQSVDVSASSQDVPSKQIASDNVDHLNLQEMNLDDCKENVQGENNFAADSRKSSAKQKFGSVLSDFLKAPTTYQKGTVPRYLRERQQQWQKAKEDEIANTPDPNCPAGHVLLPEEDRMQTLDMIKTEHASLVRELNMMPVSKDTLRGRQRKIEVEQNLTKLEEAMKLFSRPKVFVEVGK